MMGTSISHVLPPGKYFIGDPSAVFDDELLERVLRATNFFSMPTPVMIMGAKLWGMRGVTTQKVFSDQNGVEYQVNDGVLGAVPIELIDVPEGEEHGTVIDAPDGLQVAFENGVFHFNEIAINTNDPTDTDFDGGYDLDPGEDHFI